METISNMLVRVLEAAMMSAVVVIFVVMALLLLSSAGLPLEAIKPAAGFTFGFAFVLFAADEYKNV